MNRENVPRFDVLLLLLAFFHLRKYRMYLGIAIIGILVKRCLVSAKSVLHCESVFRVTKTMLGCENGQLGKNESRIIASLESHVVLV